VISVVTRARRADTQRSSTGTKISRVNTDYWLFSVGLTLLVLVVAFV